MGKYKVPTKREVRRALRALKALRDKEFNLGYNLETLQPIGVI